MLGGAGLPATAVLAQEVVGTEAIVVTGRRISQASEAIGEDRTGNVVAVTREALLSAPPGISGLKMLEQLPGFNVQTDSALGLYEFGNSVQVRAFALDQIGFVVDGIPTGRSDVFGGSPVSRYVDNENLAVVEAAFGAGDVSLPSYASLGPIVQYRSIVPQDELGLFAAQSFGDFAMKRTFVRLSTGRIGPFKGYVSRTKLDSDLWRGPGRINREHWEASLDLDLGGESWARFKVIANDFFDNDSPTIGRTQYLCARADFIGGCGRYSSLIRSVPNTTPGFAPLPSAPSVPFSNGNYTAVYDLSVNVRRDRLYGATVHAGIADGVWSEATLYWEDKNGYGVSPDSYENSLGRYRPQREAGLPVVAPRGVQFGRSGVGGGRYGLVSKLHWQAGIHAIEAGIWAEVENYHRTQARYNTQDGTPDGTPNLAELVYLRRDYRAKRDTLQVFLRDRLSLLDGRLTFDLGFKGLALDYRQRGYRDFDDYYRAVGGVGVSGWGPQVNGARYADLFLPSAGLVYRFDDRTQIFASYAETMALPKGMDDIYAVTRPDSPALVPAPRPERARDFEIGVRTNQGQFFAALAAYYTDFRDRIQSITTFVPGGGAATESFFQNVGRVEAYGLEFTGTYKPAFLRGLAYANLAVTYNVARFRDDLTGSTVVALAGKSLPDSARWIVNGGVTLEPASWLLANFSGKYTSRRWSTFANTPGSDVPGYALFSAYIDIGEGVAFGPLKGLRLRANIDNLFDTDVPAFIAPAVTGDGAFRPLSPRTFQVTLSAEL